MNRLVKRVAVALCVTLCLAGCGAKSVSVDGNEYAPDTTVLDLRGTQQPELEQIMQLQSLEELDLRDTGITAEDYEMLREALPECEILWSVPFQGGYLDSDSRTVTVTVLSEEDLLALDYLTDLDYVDASNCTDYAQLVALQQRRSDCAVDYTVSIAGQSWTTDTCEMTVDAIGEDELVKISAYLPQVTTIHLPGLREDADQLLNLMEAWPQYEFLWETEYLGVTVNSQTSFLDFSGIPIVDLEGLENFVTRLPKLEQVDMCGCKVSNEDMDALNRRYENIKFVWSINFGWVSYRTDITWFMPCQDDLWMTDQSSKLLNYFTDLECLDLGHHHITDCSFVANMPKLRYLLLGDTYITSIEPLRGLENVIYLEIFMSHVKDYTPILTLKNLEVLNISYTQGDPDVVAQLTWVDYIRWINHDDMTISVDQIEELRKQLPDTLLEMDRGAFSTGGMWRQTQHYFDMRDMVGMPYMVG